MKQLDKDQDYWQARAEAAERERDHYRDAYRNLSLALPDDYPETHKKRREAEATLAAVREWAEDKTNTPWGTGYYYAQEKVLAILDREGEK